MGIRIYREGGQFLLDADKLARRVQIDGFVVFTSTRTRQREVAHAVEQKLRAAGIEPLSGESNSPNGCMCVVNRNLYTLREITDLAAAEDRDHEDGVRDT